MNKIHFTKCGEKMSKKLVMLSIIAFVLFGCTNNDPTYEDAQNADVELLKIKSDVPVDQQPANQAKEFLSHYEEVKQVRAVNTDDDLVIAVDINHHDRFQLDHLQKELTKDVKKNFSGMTITFSTDRKILIELKRLEEDLQKQNMNVDEINERLEKIKKLSKEDT